jgi:hypothetical protein
VHPCAIRNHRVKRIAWLFGAIATARDPPGQSASQRINRRYQEARGTDTVGDADDVGAMTGSTARPATGLSGVEAHVG